MKLSKKNREIIFNKFGGKCAYCGCELQKGWHADHIEAVQRNMVIENGRIKQDGTMLNPELDIIDNFNPSCPECNLYKSSMPLSAFRKMLQEQANIARRSSKNFRFAERYGLIAVTDRAIEFYFERAENAEKAQTN